MCAQVRQISFNGTGSFAAFSPDGSWFVMSNAQTRNAVLLELPLSVDGYVDMDGQIFLPHPSGVMGVSFTSDSRFLATGCQDNKVRIFDLASPGFVDREPLVLVGHTGWVWGVAWSPDDTYLASASDDMTVRLWSAPWKEGQVIEGHSNSVVDVAWRPDGKRLVSSSRDGTARVVAIITTLQQVEEDLKRLHSRSNVNELTMRDIGKLNLPEKILDTKSLLSFLKINYNT